MIMFQKIQPAKIQNENLSGPFFSSPRQYSPKNQNTKSTKENDELTSPVVITNKKFLNTLI